MQKKRPLTESSKLTKKAFKQQESTLAADVLAGFKELIAHNKGEIKLKTRQIYILDQLDVRAVRKKSGLSQNDFAMLYGFNLRTLQQWEQGRAKPETAVLAYLKLIDKDPRSVLAALNQ